MAAFRIDTDSAAYAHGFDQGFAGRAFRCPVSGNPTAETNHHAGYVAGEAAARKGHASRAEYAAAEAASAGPTAVHYEAAYGSTQRLSFTILCF